MLRRQTSFNISLLLFLCGCMDNCLSTDKTSHIRRPSTTFPYYQRDPATSTLSVRGGSTLTRTKQKQCKRRPRPELKLAQNVVQITVQLQKDASSQIQQLQSSIDKEWNQFLTNLPKFKRPTNSKLDEVCNSFSNVLSNSKLDTALLLAACRSHLALMKSAGSSLRLVAKDLESNLNKAEKLFKQHSQCRNIYSLLELEKNMGVHNGNILKDPSAAMGLLWIRRSLSFQAELYKALALNEVHPREAAMSAYAKHLKPYHGWALSKLFSASLTQFPERRAFIAKFGGVEEVDEQIDAEVVKKLKVLVGEWEPILTIWRDNFERLDLEDTRRV